MKGRASGGRPSKAGSRFAETLRRPIHGSARPIHLREDKDKIMRRYIILPFLFAAAACASAPPKPVTYASAQSTATVTDASSADRPAARSGSAEGNQTEEIHGYLPDPVPGGP